MPADPAINEAAFAFRDENVHLWTVDLAVDESAEQNLSLLLSPDELATKNKLHFPRDQRRYAAARGTLRILLGRYLNAAPDAIALAYGPYGKPVLKPPHDRLHFNVAHSRDLAVCAFSHAPVGVDVEQVEPKPTLARLVDRLFSANDAARWQALPAKDQPRAFYRSWTWKEAYLKATGRGFASSVDGFTLQLVQGDSLALPAAWRGAGENQPWSFAHLAPCEGFIAAVAVEDEILQWRLRQWR